MSVKNASNVPPDLEPLRYQPLSVTHQEFRLLSIPPKSSGDAINYSLFHSPLNDNVDYLALSYVWGDAKKTRPITVNSQYRRVTENLAVALQNLQHDDRPIIIWIDAICINQDDDPEKSGQVQLMRQIYTTAREVIIWLGPSTPQTDCMMRGIRQLGDQLFTIGLSDLTTEQLLDLTNIGDDNSKTSVIMSEVLGLVKQHYEQVQNGEDPFQWVSSDLGKRKWFERVWTIQELSNARIATFRCGNEEVEFTRLWCVSFYAQVFKGWTIRHFTGYMRDDYQMFALTDTLGETFSTKHVGIRRRVLAGRSPSLIYLLNIANVLDESKNRINATDDRDRVYGLLGVANDAAAQNVVVDYALSPGGVYLETAKVLLKHGHSEILSLCRKRTGCEDLPSWAPDWSAPNRKPWSTWKDDRMFNACGDTIVSTSMMVSTQLKELRIHGIFVDVIKEVGQTWSLEIDDPFDYQAARKFLVDIEDYLRQSNMYDLRQKEEAKWRLPVGDIEHMGITSQLQRAGEESAATKIGYVVMRLAVEDPTTGEIQRNLQAYAHYLIQMTRMHDSRPFISEHGYVGLCPIEARPGDSVTIFLGVRVPYIIRNTQGDSFWTLVGESHVYGIMDGEYMQQKPVIESITLR